MSIRFEHALDLSCAPAKAFAILDDIAQTPKWITRVTGVEKLTNSRDAVGTRLRYSYREAGHTGSIEAEIVSRQPSEHLRLRIEDKLANVTLDFRMSPRDGGTRLVNVVEIMPKTFMARVFSPVIRNQLPKHVCAALEELRRLVEEAS